MLRTVRLLVLFVIIFSPCCACWCFRDTVSPIKKECIGQVKYIEDLLEEAPDSISSLPRLVIGRGQQNTSKEIGCISLREQDITIDYSKFDEPHICGDAWDVNTIQQVKNLYKGKFSAIVFERVSAMPLYWSKYLQSLCARTSNTFYQLPVNEQSLVQSSFMRVKEYREILQQVYEQGFGFYNTLTETKLPTLSSKIASTSSSIARPPITELVYMVKSDDIPFQNKIPLLKEILTLEPPIENKILKAYYKLLQPGGIIIFSSSSSGLNRYGGVIIEYQKRKYTPFKDLDDPHMQAVYISIFERAGFKDIKFYKDPCFVEDVLLLTATK
jgi:hypothetical protein